MYTIERHFNEHATETQAEAESWLRERGIDPAPILARTGRLAIINGKFTIPVFDDDGNFADFVTISDEPSCTCRTATGEPTHFLRLLFH